MTDPANQPVNIYPHEKERFTMSADLVLGQDGKPGIAHDVAEIKSGLAEIVTLLKWIVRGLCVSVASAGVLWGISTLWSSGVRQAAPPVTQDQTVNIGQSADDKRRESLMTLTPADVADDHGVNEDTVRRWLASGKIPGASKDNSGRWIIPTGYAVH